MIACFYVDVENFRALVRVEKDLKAHTDVRGVLDATDAEVDISWHTLEDVEKALEGK